MCDKEYLKKYYNGDIEEAIKRLENGEPVQYIVGNVDFYGLNIEVNSNVLIPRFETEQLVEKTMDYINDYFDKEVSILDIGTGSGCIAIALKRNLINTKIDAIDISEKALEIAKKNALNNKADITFYQSDLFTNVSNKYDVIISNPPYISYDEPIMDIVKNTSNEPNIALYAPNEGLYYYEEIIKNASKYLNDRFILAFEIGYLQGDKLKKIIKKYLPNTRIFLEKDLQDKNRFIFVFKDN